MRTDSSKVLCLTLVAVASEMREKHTAAIDEREAKDPQFKKLRDQLKVCCRNNASLRCTCHSKIEEILSLIASPSVPCTLQ